MTHNNPYKQINTIENIKNIHRQVKQVHNLDWELFKNKCKTKIYQHIMKQLRNQHKTLKRLNTQAKKGKNYFRLTDYQLPLSNPLVYLDEEAQFEILDELVVEMTPDIEMLYGPDFLIKVEPSPTNFSKLMTWVMYDIYAFYAESDSENENGPGIIEY